MNKEHIKHEISCLLEQQSFGVLATTGQNFPYTNLIAFKAAGKLKEILFATVRDTRKYSNLCKHSNVSLMIDNRISSSFNIKNGKALTVLGSAQEVTENEAAKYREQYLIKLPSLENFVSSPNCAIFKILVFKYIYVSNFQEVIEYEP